MNLSARMTTFGPATTLDNRRRRLPSLREDAAAPEPLAPESVWTVNRFSADRGAPRPVSGVLSSALAVLDITTLLDAGLARVVPPATAEDQGAETDAEPEERSIDQLLAGVLSGRQPSRQ